MVAAAEGGRWRRCCCWCRSWWVVETVSARTSQRARSRDRRAAQARAAGARAFPGEGLAERPPWASSPPATSGRARAPRRSAVSRLLARSSRCFPSLSSFSHPPPLAGELAFERTRVLWRTRVLGLLRPLDPLFYLRVLFPPDRGSVVAWGGEEAGCPSPPRPRSAAPFLLVLLG